MKTLDRKPDFWDLKVSPKLIVLALIASLFLLSSCGFAEGFRSASPGVGAGGPHYYGQAGGTDLVVRTTPSGRE